MSGGTALGEGIRLLANGVLGRSAPWPVVVEGRKVGGGRTDLTNAGRWWEEGGRWVKSRGGLEAAMAVVFWLSWRSEDKSWKTPGQKDYSHRFQMTVCAGIGHGDSCKDLMSETCVCLTYSPTSRGKTTRFAADSDFQKGEGRERKRETKRVGGGWVGGKNTSAHGNQRWTFRIN